MVQEGNSSSKSPQRGLYHVRHLCLTHSAGSAECPPNCSHDFPPHTRWQTFPVVPEAQGAQLALEHPAAQEGLVVL